MPSDIEKASAALVFTIILVGAGLYFLYNSVNLITASTPHVAASLLAAVIGLSLVSAGITLLRTWIIASTVGSKREEE
jgi:hypothetical protein